MTNKIKTKVTVKGIVQGKRDNYSSVSDELGYYDASPLETLKEFSKSYGIAEYKGFLAPFGSEDGLKIEEAESVPGRFSLRPLTALEDEIKEIDLPHSGVYRNPSAIAYVDGTNKYPLSFEKPLTEKNLKNTFLNRIKKFKSSKRFYEGIETLTYWRNLDNDLVRKINDELFDIGVPYEKLSFRKYFENIDQRRYSMEPILEGIKKEYPELTPEILKAAYDQVAKDHKFSIPIELMNLFGIPNATYEDFKKMIKPKEVNL